jgi:hypothetical protein
LELLVTFAYVPITVMLPENATIPAARGCTFRSCCIASKGSSFVLPLLLLLMHLVLMVLRLLNKQGYGKAVTIKSTARKARPQPE